MVLGAGRGPLVEATLKAAERAEADGLTWQLLAHGKHPSLTVLLNHCQPDFDTGLAEQQQRVAYV